MAHLHPWLEVRPVGHALVEVLLEQHLERAEHSLSYISHCALYKPMKLKECSGQHLELAEPDGDDRGPARLDRTRVSLQLQ